MCPRLFRASSGTTSACFCRSRNWTAKALNISLRLRCQLFSCISSFENPRLSMTTQRTVINWLLVYLLSFISGSWRYNLSGNRYLVLGFLVALTAWYLFTDRKISDRFLLYALVFFGFLFSLSLYTGGGITLPSTIAGADEVGDRISHT